MQQGIVSVPADKILLTDDDRFETNYAGKLYEELRATDPQRALQLSVGSDMYVVVPAWRQQELMVAIPQAYMDKVLPILIEEYALENKFLQEIEEQGDTIPRGRVAEMRSEINAASQKLKPYVSHETAEYINHEGDFKSVLQCFLTWNCIHEGSDVYTECEEIWEELDPEE